MQTQGTKLDFSGQNIYAGIDVHLKSWKVTIMVGDIQCKTFSQDPDPQILKNYLNKNYPGGNYFSAYEAGFCGFTHHRRLIQQGITNIIIHPADIPTTDKEKKQKEDKRDSRKIVRSLYNDQLQPIYIPSMETEGLRTLVRYRKSLVKEINRYRYRTKSLLYYYGIKIPPEIENSSKHWSKRYTIWLRSVEFNTWYAQSSLHEIIEIVDFLRAKLLHVNKQLRQIESDSQYAHSIGLLRSIPGIGLITALTLVTELDNISRFGNLDRLCSYVGLIPSTHSSGNNHRTGGITNRSNKQLRSMLIESAWIAIRQDPALSMKYQKLRQRMQPNKAIVRIAKRLLSRIKHVLDNNEPYTLGKVN
jgi:transposase